MASYLNSSGFCRNNNDDRIDPHRKRVLWARIFKVLNKREKVHINKFLLVRGLLNNIQLTQLGIAESGYQIDNINSQNHSTSFSSDSKYVLTLKKDTIGSQILDPGDNIR